MPVTVPLILRDLASLHQYPLLVALGVNPIMRPIDLALLEEIRALEKAIWNDVKASPQQRAASTKLLHEAANPPRKHLVRLSLNSADKLSQCTR